MPSQDDVARYRDNRQDEMNSAALSRTFAALEPQTQLAQLSERLATVEDRHARFWEQYLRAAGASVPPPRPSWRAACSSGWPNALDRSGSCRPSPRSSAWTVTCMIASLKHNRPDSRSMSAPTPASSAPSSARRASRATHSPASKGATGPLAGTRCVPPCWGRMTAWSPISVWSWGWREPRSRDRRSW
jgi:hypothetical protein